MPCGPERVRASCVSPRAGRCYAAGAVGRLPRLEVSLALVVLAAAGLGCPASTAVRDVSPSQLDGNLRLGREVVPEHYRLDLRIDPRETRFSGEVEIAIRIAVPTRRVQLHAADMDLGRVEV